MRRRLKPQGLFQGAGGNRSWRAPRGARECSPWRAAERGGGPGARSSRRRICPAPAPGGVAGVVRAAAPGSRVRLPGWVRSAGRGPAAVPARAAAAAASRAPGTSAGRPPLPSRRRRGPCVQARSGEGGKEKGEAASGAGGAGGKAATGAGAPRCALAGGTRRGRLRRRAGTRAQPGRNGLHVLPLPCGENGWGVEGGGLEAGPPWGRGGRLSKPASSAGAGKRQRGSRSRSLSLHPFSLYPLIHFFLPTISIHSFIHPSTHAFIREQVSNRLLCVRK